MNKSTLRTAIILLAVITAMIHIGLTLVLEGPMQTMFLLNGIGYLVLLWATMWPPAALEKQRTLLHYVFMTFAVVTIVAYFVVNGFKVDALGWFTKLVEVLLVVALFQHLRK